MVPGRLALGREAIKVNERVVLVGVHSNQVHPDVGVERKFTAPDAFS
jgi:hypothetical protein